MPDDAQNLFIALTAKKMNEKLRITCHASDQVDVKKFFLVGVDEVVSGDFIIGRKLAMTMQNDNVLAFLDQVNYMEGGAPIYLADAQVRAGSPWIGKQLREASLPQTTGVLVIAMRKTGSAEFCFNPGPDAVLGAGDVLIFMGSAEKQKEVQACLDGRKVC